MKKIKSLIPLVLTVVVLFILISKIDSKNIIDSIRLADKKLLFVSVLILLATLFITARRWQKVLEITKFKITFGQALKTYLATLPISKITPGNAGDFVRAFYLKDRVPLAINIGAIFLERIFDIAALAILSIIGGLFLNQRLIALIGGMILAAIFIFFLTAPRLNLNPSSKWRQRISGFFQAFRIIKSQPLALLKIIGYTFLLWLTIIIYFKISFLAFGSDIPLLSILAIQPIVIFIGLLPITVSGIGTRETAMIYLYSTLAPYSRILAVGLIYSFVGAIVFAIIGLPFMLKIVKPKFNQ